VLTYVSLSGWGAKGPWADWRSYGPSIEAASSIEGRTGYAGGEPLRLGHALPDGIGGLVGTLAALRGLRRTMAGETGGWFDISQLEAYVALSGDGIVDATRHGLGIARAGNRSRHSGVIQGAFPCRGDDEWIAIRLEGEGDRATFASASGLADTLPADLDQAEAAIAGVTREHDKFALTERLQAAGIEAFPALNALELMADPQLAQRRYFVPVPVGDRTCPMPGTPLVATPVMADATAPAPQPGEHSDEIRAELALILPDL
jgi:crotonobetainyl-CoA:carnitine CoA-transferase CaiB-like acyl-CoA transferase